MRRLVGEVGGVRTTLVIMFPIRIAGNSFADKSSDIWARSVLKVSLTHSLAAALSIRCSYLSLFKIKWEISF